MGAVSSSTPTDVGKEVMLKMENYVILTQEGNSVREINSDERADDLQPADSSTVRSIEQGTVPHIADDHSDTLHTADNKSASADKGSKQADEGIDLETPDTTKIEEFACSLVAEDANADNKLASTEKGSKQADEGIDLETPDTTKIEEIACSLVAEDANADNKLESTEKGSKQADQGIDLGMPDTTNVEEFACSLVAEEVNADNKLASTEEGSKQGDQGIALGTPDTINIEECACSNAEILVQSPSVCDANDLKLADEKGSNNDLVLGDAAGDKITTRELDLNT